MQPALSVAMPDGSPPSFRALAIFVLSLFAIADAPAARAETLTIQGSSTASITLLTPNQAMIESLSGQSLKIVGIRSDIGLLRLLARQAEFAVISTSLKQSVNLLRANNPGLPYDKLVAFPVSHVRVAFAVNPNNPVRNVDMRSIRRILSGELTNWKQLGGADEQIRVAYVQSGGGVTLSVAGELFGGQPFTPANPIRVSFGAQVVKVVEQEPRALGVAQIGLIKEHQLPELMTNQLIEQELSLVTLGEPSPQQQAVINAVRQVAANLGIQVQK
jgi:ABC-type phosphate transport system substrate-binding protein